MQTFLLADLLVTLISNFNLLLSFFGSFLNTFYMLQDLLFLFLSLLLLHSFFYLFELFLFFSSHFLSEFLFSGDFLSSLLYLLSPLLFSWATHRKRLSHTMGAPFVKLIISVEGIDWIGQVAQLMLKHLFFLLSLHKYFKPEHIFVTFLIIFIFDRYFLTWYVSIPINYLQVDGIDGFFHVHFGDIARFGFYFI